MSAAGAAELRPELHVQFLTDALMIVFEAQSCAGRLWRKMARHGKAQRERCVQPHAVLTGSPTALRRRSRHNGQSVLQQRRYTTDADSGYTLCNACALRLSMATPTLVLLQTGC